MLRLFVVYMVMFSYSVGAVGGERLRSRSAVVPTLLDAAIVFTAMLAVGFDLLGTGAHPVTMVAAAAFCGFMVHLLRPAPLERILPP